MKPFRLRVDIV